MECTKLQQLIASNPHSTVQLPSPPHSNMQIQNKSNPPARAKQTTLQANPASPYTNPPPTSTDSDANINSALDTLCDFGLTINNSTNKETNIIYLTLTSRSVTLQPHHTTSHTTVVDSGAYPMMFQSKEYFTPLEPWTNTTSTQVTLADGNSTAPIHGIGTVKFLINNTFPVEFHNVLFAPSLSTNLFSVKEFLRYQGTMILGLHNKFTLAFPTFLVDDTICDKITFQTTPTNQPPIFTSSTSPLHPHDSPSYIPK